MSEKASYVVQGRDRDATGQGFPVDWLRSAIALLFFGLAAIQYADLHSSLTASAHQAEANRLIVSLTHWMSPVSALFCVKAVAFTALFLLHRAWGGGGPDDRRWFAFLSLAFVSSLAIVVNNYFAR